MRPARSGGRFAGKYDLAAPFETAPEAAPLGEAAHPPGAILSFSGPPLVATDNYAGYLFARSSASAAFDLAFEA